jgi:hypothetical protein
LTDSSSGSLLCSSDDRSKSEDAKDVLHDVERGSVRFGGIAERLEIREDIGDSDREGEREAREEFRVVGGGSYVDCCRLVWRTRVGRRGAMYKQFNPEPLNSMASANMKARFNT